MCYMANMARKVKARDARGKQKTGATFCLETMQSLS